MFDELLQNNGLENNIVRSVEVQAQNKTVPWSELYQKKTNPTTLKRMVAACQPLPEIKRDTEYWLRKLITEDTSMLELKDKVRKLAPLTHAVLIEGETGTGKESIARALHGDRLGSFVAVNCGGFPELLVDSILFGHVKGAFTGASEDKSGLFAAANNGTIFLDEVSRLPLHMQPKLLRVLQEQEIVPVGSSDTFKVNVRVVAATNQNLTELVSKNRFQDDLLWRLNTFIIETKPLRDRVKDVMLYALSQGVSITEDEVNNCQWRGNYRELQQFLLRRKVFGI